VTINNTSQTHARAHTHTHRPGSPDSTLGDKEEGPENLSLELIIRTTEKGYSGGRSYIYRTSFDNATTWEADIDHVCVCVCVCVCVYNI
jgi:hypothetical protein